MYNNPNKTIGEISRENVSSIVDQDKVRNKLKLNVRGQNPINIVSPDLSYLIKNKYYLLSNSEIIKIGPEGYNYRPDLLSYKKYGTERLWYVIMAINGVFCMEEFVDLEIFVPSISSISAVLSSGSKNIIKAELDYVL